MKLKDLPQILAAFRTQLLALLNPDAENEPYLTEGNVLLYYEGGRFNSQQTDTYPCVMVVPDRGVFTSGPGGQLEDAAWFMVYVLDWNTDTSALQTSLLNWIDRIQKMLEDHLSLGDTVTSAQVVDWTLDAGALAPLGVALLAVEIKRMGS